MITPISSVSVGYFVLLKIDLPNADFDLLRSRASDLGYSILKDNRQVLFCKHRVVNWDYDLVKQDFEAIFGFLPRVFTDLEQFFTRNDL